MPPNDISRAKEGTPDTARPSVSLFGARPGVGSRCPSTGDHDGAETVASRLSLRCRLQALDFSAEIKTGEKGTLARGLSHL